MKGIEKTFLMSIGASARLTLHRTATDPDLSPELYRITARMLDIPSSSIRMGMCKLADQ